MRESPTWAMATLFFSTSMHDAVQPMPGLPLPVLAPSITLAFAASTAAPRRTSSAWSGAFAAMVSTAIELATSPAACPPMPSHTANTGACTRNESSLWLRTRPMSVRAPQASMPLAPFLESVPSRFSTGMTSWPGLATGFLAPCPAILVYRLSRWRGSGSGFSFIGGSHA